MPPKPKKKFVPLGNAAQSPREGLEGAASSNAGASQRGARHGPTPSEALSRSIASTDNGGAGAVLAPHPAAIKAAEEAESILLSPQEGDHCFICTDPISWYAVGECNHRVCHLCSLRLRALLKDNNCSMCKTPLSDVIFTGDSSKPFSDFSLNRMAKVDRKLSIHFDSVEAYDDVMILLRFNCPDSDCDVACAQGWPELKKHVRQAHNKFLCDLCTRHKRLFTHEHTMYTQAELDRHFKTGDPNDSSFKGHPKCGFCKIHFYGDDELYEHCRKQHEQCFLCTSAGIRHQYYENYDALEKHFRKEHFCCMDPECLEKKFQVFFSDIDLKAHEMQVHSTKRMGRGKGQKIDINFSIAGSPSLDLGSRAGNGSGGGRGGGSGGGGGRNNRRRGEDNRESDRNQDEEDREFGSRSGLQAPAGFGSQLSQSRPAPTPAESVNALQRQPSGDYPSIQTNFPSAVASSGPAARYASSVAGGITIDRSDMSFPLPGRVLDRSENNFPPPARAVTQPSNSVSASSANSSGSMMDAGTLKTLQDLFDSDASKLDQLKSIAKMYKSDLTTCPEFLNFFISLVFEGRHSASEPVKREIVGKAGKVWRALADSIPDEEMSSKVSQRDRKSNASKREEMLRVWNDYKVKNDSNFSNPYLESSYANPVSKSGAATSNSRSSGSGGSPTQSARVLVIKSKATHQRNTPMWNAMSKGKGFVSSLEDSRKQQPAFDTGSSSSSSGSGPEFRTGLSAVAATTPLQPQQGQQQQQQQMWGSSPAPAKSAANEFPGLPSRANVIPAYVKKGAPSSINEWSADGGSSYGGLNENQGAQSSQGGKKKKKEKIVLMKVGL